TYLCPSDANNQTPYSDGGTGSPPETGWARGNYAANVGFDDIDHCSGGRVYTFNGSGPLKGVTVSVVFAVNYGATLPDITDSTTNDSAMARSLHSGGVNACFADGSVKFIKNDITELTWGLLQSKADGLVITEAY